VSRIFKKHTHTRQGDVTAEPDEQPAAVETPDVTELIEEIDEVLSGCTDDAALERDLKANHERYIADTDDMSVWNDEFDRRYNEYFDAKLRVYEAHGTTRSAWLDKKGCGCGCPTYF
jgi:hypothetical protein